MSCIKLYINIRVRIHLHEAQQIREKNSMETFAICKSARIIRESCNGEKISAGWYFFFKSISITHNGESDTRLSWRDKCLKIANIGASFRRRRVPRKKLSTSWILYRAISYPLFPLTRGRISGRRRARLEVRTGIWSKPVTLRARLRHYPFASS